MTNVVSLWQRCLIPAYYYGTWPLRHAGRTLAGWTGQLPVMVIFYHRVADHDLSPWTIGNDAFRRQVDWLADHFELLSLADAQQRIADRASFRPAVCITFDDGYAENCDRALPYLISKRIPITYFVSTQFVERRAPFPHDLQRGTPHAPNSVEQLRSLAAAGVELGAHTRTHADLGQVQDESRLRDEILGSRHDLEDWLGRPVRYFAFPYGQRANLHPAAFQLTRDAGLAGVCSAYGGYNFPGDDPFHLRRLHADPHFPRLKNWLTFDPRIVLGRRAEPSWNG